MKALGTALVLLSLAGCQKFHVQTPNEFLALEETGGDDAFAYRATSADGVVLAVRDIRNEPYGDLEFWSDAVRARLRLGKGYALLDEQKARAQSGQQGMLLRFGREEHGKPYAYVVTLFVTDAHVFVIESGGRKERFEAREQAITKALESFRIRGLGTGTRD